MQDHSGMISIRSHEFFRKYFSPVFLKGIYHYVGPTLTHGLASGLAVVLHLTWLFIGPFQSLSSPLRTNGKAAACVGVLLAVLCCSGAVFKVHVVTNHLSQLLTGQTEAVGRRPCAL
ncbi:MAG: hypothetical protein JWM59_1866 [Verrucomicrobiales bacterium]|nr:hypothetical protein [Verrucomicrobiales bacterium]